MSGYTLHLLALAGALAAGAIGWQVVFGLAGALSLAAGTAMGLGAYVAILLPHWGYTYIEAILAAAIAPALILGGLTLIIQKLESHYFALATLAFAELALVIATNWETVTGGANGLLAIPRPSWLTSAEARAGFAWAAALAATGLFYWFRQWQGRERLALLRAEPLAAKAFGMDAGLTRVAAMMFGAACGGLGGAALALAVGLVSPDALAFKAMAAILAVVIIGGRRSPLAAMALALLVTWTPEWLRFLEQTYLIAFGAMMLFAIWIAPDGLSAWITKAVAAFRPRPAPPPPPPSLKPKSAIPTRLLGARGRHSHLEVSQVSRCFGGVQALADVSLSVSAGEIVGLIGPNGAGKSTLLNLLTGLDTPSAGDITVTGLIGRTFQTPALIEDMTALENVRACGCNTDDALACLAATGLAANHATPARSLPQSARRTLEIARALGRRPSILLLDEPAAGLSPPERLALAALLRRIAATGMAILIVEHDVPFLASLAGRLICISEGRNIAEGNPNDVTRDPDVIIAYLGAPLTNAAAAMGTEI